MAETPEKSERKESAAGVELAEIRVDAFPAPPMRDLPKQLPLLPLRSDVPFPQVIMPLIVGRDKGIQLLDDVMKGNKIVGLATQMNLEAEDPGPKDLYPTICVAQVLKMLKFPDGSTRIVAQGLRRARWTSISKSEPYLIGNIAAVEEINEVGVETEALMLSIRRLLEKFLEAGGQAAEELQVAAMNTPEPGAWCDLLSSGLPFSTEEKQELLAEPSVKARLKRLHQLLRYQVEMNSLSTKINSEASGEMNRAQRETFLRQQMSAIKRELGEGEEEGGEIREFLDRLENAKLPDAAHAEAKRELDRMQQMHPSTPEYHVIRTFIDTMLSMPWHTSTEDRLDIRRARRILDEDHYGLEPVKQRILEFLSVRKLKDDMRGPILCFVGPPGVGKTSLGKSIARTMDRKFTRISLGGVHDEAEIRGHRRTYIGAMPGRIIQGLRKLSVNNPVFMLDEIDKLGADHRGDPSSALLEVLDPEQNNSFRDHYLDVEFDLSKVLFICTANVLQTIPSPLRDRMEVIEISGYSEEEKLAIAKKYLIPKQLREHGLPTEAAEFTDEGIRFLIDGYTHEAGLRNLEREIASLCRKIARQYAEGKKKKNLVDSKKIEQLLNAPKIVHDRRVDATTPGVATGLAWTPVGGVTLSIESARAPGKNSFKLTGSLGDVMKESAHAAASYLRARCEELEIPKEFFDEGELHVHVPAGAIAKDGPSAGVAMLASLLSLAKGKALRPGLAMTGEITLSGRVLAVGGIREKILAARRENIDTVILPATNEKEVDDLPKYVRDEFTFIYAKQIDEVMLHFFTDEKQKQPRKGKAKIVRGKNVGKPRMQSPAASM
jgi:ATP-dependent Lon protease